MLHWAWNWYPDWIKAKKAEMEERRQVTRLCSEDSSLTRAKKMMKHVGVTMDSNMLGLLPGMAEVLDAYKQLDEEARLQK